MRNDGTCSNNQDLKFIFGNKIQNGKGHFSMQISVLLSCTDCIGTTRINVQSIATRFHSNEKFSSKDCHAYIRLMKKTFFEYSIYIALALRNLSQNLSSERSMIQIKQFCA